MLKQPFSARLNNRFPSLAVPVPGRAWPALAAGVLWLAAGVCTGSWLLQLWGRGPLIPVAAIAGNPIQADAASVARALGAPPEAQAAAAVAPPASSRFRLIGLVSQPGQRGAALIAVDGQPPRPITIGSVVEGELVLLSVGRRVARLGSASGGAESLELSLPEAPE
ncbi:general secretion pathway protein C [Hydrogenophaga sp. SL48]|uniref:general secretion pathway protein C n=1 Tax=Hydrogenophaga sp. SL48 TaxID=2806347 RepID=UPI001F1C8AED|nr:general secretion pathway protein C [Hydrogenophaga sp. SL48]UJW81379.1 general secretion pathway protein C [Hydrogenophaga sp. SL48]